MTNANDWDKTKSHTSDLNTAVHNAKVAQLHITAMIDAISDHDQPDLRAKAIEMRRKFKIFEDTLGKVANTP